MNAPANVRIADSGDFQLTEGEAFLAMSRFLDGFYARTGGHMPTLMTEIEVQSDGGTYDPAAWQDWIEAVRSVVVAPSDAEVRTDDSVVVCCFCGESVPALIATTLVIRPATAPGESQVLLCHGKHLVERIHDDIPHHWALDD